MSITTKLDLTTPGGPWQQQTSRPPSEQGRKSREYRFGPVNVWCSVVDIADLHGSGSPITNACAPLEGPVSDQDSDWRVAVGAHLQYGSSRRQKTDCRNHPIFADAHPYNIARPLICILRRPHRCTLVEQLTHRRPHI